MVYQKKKKKRKSKSKNKCNKVNVIRTHTLYELKNFSVTQILREIIVDNSKDAKFAILTPI